MCIPHYTVTGIAISPKGIFGVRYFLGGCNIIIVEKMIGIGKYGIKPVLRSAGICSPDVT
jgi:hypothetical protein